MGKKSGLFYWLLWLFLVGITVGLIYADRVLYIEKGWLWWAVALSITLAYLICFMLAWVVPTRKLDRGKE